MEKKYTTIQEGDMLRIKALKAFGKVGEGELGGLIESEKNLSQSGNAWVSGNAVVYGNADIIVFKNWWSSGRWFTWTRSNDMWKVGCFYGTGEELIKKAYADSELSGRGYERIVKYVESIKETINELSKNA